MCKELDNYFKQFFIAVYDQYDNNVGQIENIEMCSQFFNIPKFRLYQKLRNNESIIFNGSKFNLYLVPKEKKEIIRRKK